MEKNIENIEKQCFFHMEKNLVGATKCSRFFYIWKKTLWQVSWEKTLCGSTLWVGDGFERLTTASQKAHGRVMGCQHTSLGSC